MQFGHDVEVHAVDAGDHGGRQEHHRGDREDLDDLVLFDIDEALGGVHQEVDLLEQEGGVGHQGVQVVLDFRAGAAAVLVGAHVALDKGDRALGVHQAEPDLAVAVLQVGQLFDAVFQLRLFVFQHQVADFLQVAVDVLQAVRHVFHFLLENAEQNVQRRLGLYPAAAHTQAHEAEIRQP